jgi:hypothetical protein
VSRYGWDGNQCAWWAIAAYAAYNYATGDDYEPGQNMDYFMSWPSMTTLPSQPSSRTSAGSCRTSWTGCWIGAGRHDLVHQAAVP